MSKAVQSKLDDVQKAVDRAGKALEDARKSIDELMAKWTTPAEPKATSPRSPQFHP
jgi:hypothetical protein